MHPFKITVKAETALPARLREAMRRRALIVTAAITKT
jgi:hypothetical protein